MENKRKRNKIAVTQIVPLGNQRQISLDCPYCEEFKLVTIRRKFRIKGIINYEVSCPKCGNSFKQVGRRYNYWRDLKQKGKLTPRQIRSLQKQKWGEIFGTGNTKTVENKDKISAMKVIRSNTKKR